MYLGQRKRMIVSHIHQKELWHLRIHTYFAMEVSFPLFPMTILFFKANIGFTFACTGFVLELELSFSHVKRTNTSGHFKLACIFVCFCHVSKCVHVWFLMSLLPIFLGCS